MLIFTPAEIAEVSTLVDVLEYEFRESHGLYAVAHATEGADRQAEYFASQNRRLSVARSDAYATLAFQTTAQRDPRFRAEISSC